MKGGKSLLGLYIFSPVHFRSWSAERVDRALARPICPPKPFSPEHPYLCVPARRPRAGPVPTLEDIQPPAKARPSPGPSGAAYQHWEETQRSQTRDGDTLYPERRSVTDEKEQARKRLDLVSAGAAEVQQAGDVCPQSPTARCVDPRNARGASTSIPKSPGSDQTQFRKDRPT